MNRSPKNPEQHRIRGLAVASKAVSTVFLAVCLGLAGLMLLPALLGYERYVITSGSMTGTFGQGSLIYDERVPTSELAVGDVITYTPPPEVGIDEMITHRIVWVGRDERGNPAFRTKGDANATPDPWKFSLESPTQARVSFHVPFVGYAFAALSVRNIRMLVIGLPALLIAVAVVVGLARDIRREARHGTAALVKAPRGSTR